LFSQNSQYFGQRDLAVRQKNIYRFLWELCIRNLPCASVLITSNRFSIDRLKTVYHERDSEDLKPFSALGNEVPLHGFLSDKDETKPKSSLLDAMLRRGLQDAHVIHVMRLKDNRIIFVDEQDYLYGKARKQISDLSKESKVDTVVTKLSAISCKSPTTPLTSKRLAQLSKIDIDMYEKLLAMQKGYTHVLYISNVSCFQKALLDNDLAPFKAM
jgi:hypothetical protein